MGKFVRYAIFVALGFLAACATEVQPTDHSAVVRAGPWGKVYRGGYVEVASIQGGEAGWRLRSAVEVPAGDQSGMFYVYLCNGDTAHCCWIAQAQIRFVVEAGRIYQARAREQVNGSNQFWVWVEDHATGKVVGGIAPQGLASGDRQSESPSSR